MSVTSKGPVLWPSVRSEFARLRRPAALIGILGFASFSLLLALRLQGQAASRFETMPRGLAGSEARCNAGTGQCRAGGTWVTAPEGVLRDHYRLAHAAQSPLGAGALAGGLGASVPGLFVLAVVAALHVAGEFSIGTAALRRARDPRIGVFVFGKFVSLWAFAMAMLASAWVVLALAGSATRLMFEVPPPPSGFDAEGYALQQILRAAVVMGSASALFLFVAIATREPVATTALSVTGLVVLLSMSITELGCRWSWACWVAKWMSFRREDYLAGFVWAVAEGVNIPVAAQIVGILAMTVLGLFGSLLAMRQLRA